MDAGKWLTLSILAKFGDVATTYLLLTNEWAQELNPFVVSMINAYGLVPALSVSFVVYMLLMIILYKFERKAYLKIAAVIMLMVVLSNCIMMGMGLR